MSRSERFRARVKIERDILRIVNSQCPNNQLRGLSIDAIALWKATVLLTSEQADLIESVSRCLSEISVKLKVNAASSRIAFDTDGLDFSIYEEQAKLVSALEKLHVNS